MLLLGGHVKSLFTQHPHEVGETYGEHLRIAGMSSLKLLWAGIACGIHSIFPFLFIKTASGIIKEIHTKMESRQENK